MSVLYLFMFQLHISYGLLWNICTSSCAVIPSTLKITAVGIDKTIADLFIDYAKLVITPVIRLSVRILRR